MKNLKLLLLILLGISSCSTDESMSDEYVNGTTPKEKMANPNRRTITEAMEIANNSFTYDSGCSSPNAPAYSYINDYRYFTVTH